MTRQRLASKWYKNILKTIKCYYCLKIIPLILRTRDHIIPLSKGGKTHKNNVVMACDLCNRTKSNKSIDIFIWKTFYE